MFVRHRQPWQCSIHVITDCGGELSCFCQLAVPTVGNCRHAGGGGGAVVTND